MDCNTRNKQVKSILSKKYGHKNVSVTGGRGTAYGWCEVYITQPKPKNCICQEFYCDVCKKVMHAIRLEVEKLLHNVEFYKYTDDMGYDHKEVLIQVSLR